MFYVIEDGTFTIFKVEGQELARVSKGSCFGELALLRQVGGTHSILLHASWHHSPINVTPRKLHVIMQCKPPAAEDIGLSGSAHPYTRQASLGLALRLIPFVS